MSGRKNHKHRLSAYFTISPIRVFVILNPRGTIRRGDIMPSGCCAFWLVVAIDPT